MANTPAASPTVSSTVGLKNMVIAPLTVDTEETLTYGDLQLVAGARAHPGGIPLDRGLCRRASRHHALVGRVRSAGLEYGELAGCRCAYGSLHRAVLGGSLIPP